MTSEPNDRHQKFVAIVDQSGAVILSVRDVVFRETGNAFCGSYEWRIAVPALSSLLSELEDIIEHQSFAHLDEVQEKIDGFNLRAHSEAGPSIRIKDLYLSRDGGFSFRAAD